MSELVEIDVTQLKLDEGNPRTTTFYQTHDIESVTTELRQKTLSQIIMNSDGHKALKEQVTQCGNIIVPILVNETEDGTLVVFDGNNRCAIAMKLHNDALESGNQQEADKWKMVPARKYTHLDNADIDRIRSQVHTGGVKEWGPYATAKDLKRQTEEHNDNKRSIQQIAVDAKKSVSDIQRIVDAFNLMINTYLPLLQQDDPDTEEWYRPYQRKYSHFYEFLDGNIQLAVKNKCQRDNAENQDYDVDDYKNIFCTWVKEGRISAGEHVRHIADIFINTKANEAFFKPGGNTKEALKFLNTPDLSYIDIKYLAETLEMRVLNMGTEETLNFDAYPECINMIESVVEKLETYKSIQSTHGSEHAE